MIFGENNVLCPKYINIYEFWGGRGRRTWSTEHILFISQKKPEKVQEYLYLNQILHDFYLNIFFPRMNNKKRTKWGPQGAPLGPPDRKHHYTEPQYRVTGNVTFHEGDIDNMNYR